MALGYPTLKRRANPQKALVTFGVETGADAHC